MGSPYKRSTKLLGYYPLHIIWMFSLLWFCKLCIICCVQTWIQDLLLQDQDHGSRLVYPRPRPRPRLWGSKTKTKTKTLRFQDQDQDSEVPRPRPRPRLWGSRPRPRPRLWCPRPRPRLKTYKTNTGSPWLGWTVANKKTEKSWQAENPSYW